ncbi:MAG: hypothetical protein KF716_08445 [Anaerolineae bacterium]|nr:hypothetical protein [Anaerolineae bacterium]
MKIPKLLRRIGCGALLVVWFLAMLTPCAVVVLATQGEIKITYSDLPEDDLRIWTVSSPDSRGIAVSNSRRMTPVQPISTATYHDTMCQIIDIRFILWQGSADSSHQCYCYGKSEDQWDIVVDGTKACQLAGESP